MENLGLSQPRRSIKVLVYVEYLFAGSANTHIPEYDMVAYVANIFSH